jgi:hypothetical protein
MARKSINGALLLTVGLPVLAIAFSVGASVVAFTRGDTALPEQYHWEGMQLDRDFADAQRASELDVRARLQLRAAGSACRLTLQLDAPLPEALQLNLVHATRRDLDRQVRLSRVGQVYEGQCGPAPDGHWHVELADARREWLVREDVSGSLNGARLSARPHSG